ncbi:MAG TPA: choline kinase family protein [Anaerolineaceae bacterium]|nr:choline kinase family protein [Anaerolineaceae bacterium]
MTFTEVPASVQQVIARIPAWRDDRSLRVERMAGLTNANYRITAEGEQFVLRISGPNTAHLGIDRRHELAALQAAAAANLGPDVVAFLLPEGHLVTRWVAGYHWEPAEYRTPENVHLLTETVKRIHALPANGAVFSPFQRVNSFWHTAQKYNVPPPAGLDTFFETMHAIENDQQTDSSDWQHFCHNDLVCVNYLYIEAEHRIKVLDWEFSGLGDVYYDLATVVYTHDSEGPIPHDLEEVLLAAYFGAPTDFQRQRLLGMKFMLLLFTGFWGLAQHGMQRAGLVPTVSDFDYLEFAEHLFAHDICELQARYHAVLGA